MAENHPTSPEQGNPAEPQNAETDFRISGVTGTLLVDLVPRFVPQPGSSMMVLFGENGRCQYFYLPKDYGPADARTEYERAQADRAAAEREAEAQGTLAVLAERALNEEGAKLVKAATGVDLDEARRAVEETPEPIKADEALRRLWGDMGNKGTDND